MDRGEFTFSQQVIAESRTESAVSELLEEIKRLRRTRRELVKRVILLQGIVIRDMEREHEQHTEDQADGFAE